MKKLEYSVWKVGIIVTILLLMATANVSAAPSVEWSKTFDLTNHCEGLDYCSWSETIAKSVIPAKEGGYIIAGYRSYGSVPPEGGDVTVKNSYIIKTDINGNKLWKKTFDGINDDNMAFSTSQTLDGGYILAGVEDNKGWLIKTDKNGVKVWDKKYGNGEFYSVQQTRDGGYIATGFGTYTIKTLSNGNEQWHKTFTGFTYAQSVKQTQDGGYIFVGYNNGIAFYGSWIIKTDMNGNIQWNKKFQGVDNIFMDIQQTSDGNYILAGSKAYNIWLLNVDSHGNILWSKTYGTGKANSLQRVKDEGYVIAGDFQWYNKAFIIKTDRDGNLQWNKKFEDNTNSFYSIRQTNDGGYIVAGSNGTGDYLNAWLLKLSGEISTVNLLKNPGFEEIYNSIPKYWKKSQTGTKAIFIYPEIGRGGTGKSIAIKYLTRETGKAGLWSQSGIIVSSSSQYKLSGYMKLEGVTGSGAIPKPGGASLRINWYRSDGGLIKVDWIVKKGTIGWTKYEKIFTAPSNAVRATVGGDLFDSSGKVTFDDLSFVKIS